jgi:deoxyribose-phosphate aldolase
MNLADFIDHTTLQPTATPADIDALIAEAIEYRFAAVCVNGCYVKQVAAAMGDTPIKTAAVVGFPLGAMNQRAMIYETITACEDGAKEIDFVAHLPTLLDAVADATQSRFGELVEAARSVRSDVVVKVILETAALMAKVDATEVQRRIASACSAAEQAGCDFVKTSTGFHPAGGATVPAVTLLRKYAGSMKVKAAGGIRRYDDAIAMIDAGADRLGTSAGVAIMQRAAKI